jgi:RNA polymerase sigma-70 factor (ECF subfamily)
VAGVRSGDERSFEQLVDRYRAPLTAYVCSRVGDLGRSEDIAQEVFIAALRSMRASERPIVFKPWIYEIARNACIDQHRWRGRHAESALTDELVAPGPSCDPHAALELRQQLATLCQAFGELPRIDRELLGMRELAGRSYAELAASTGLTVSAVESALHRARQRLLGHYRRLNGERSPRTVIGSRPRLGGGIPAAGRLWDTSGVHRGVAQPGSAHRSGR